MDENMPGAANLLSVAKLLDAADVEYASLVNLMRVCKNLRNAFQKAAPATIQFMRALLRDATAIRCQTVIEPTAFRCIRNGDLHIVVSIVGVDRMRVCYMKPSSPYVNELSAISSEDGHFKGKMVYVNLLKRNVLCLDFDVTVPWHIHGFPRNVEDGFVE